ncbi:hypothetical protein HG535_0G00880 [Zygotorulaspora mrakii]|uniref:phosphatidylinositol-3,4,5-trisphosphate 3-phosphatase n=1 Tax=Zygotorulaspora mrakii TaxID=42260 RepID=A0A7H9B7H5_ZYGMR|nr:uncharacterized protein HG535_0G00880 [Zygotorulaspora mrakii]QLG74204.1 hypothetical protein HG535_0G00880 [Zygotorulaspora mrakii]
MTFRHTKIKPRNIFRLLYAAPMNVHKNELGLALDISYITPNIIVCSYPVTNFPRLMYRNSLEELVAFLNFHHGIGNWKIYNFKVEKCSSDYTDDDLIYSIQLSQYGSTERRLLPNANYATHNLTAEMFGENCIDQVLLRKGWLDHCPPPFLLLQEIIDDIYQHTSQSESSVAVLHCKMGKGRSGTVCIAYLMKYLESPLSDARDVFMDKRFRPGLSKGVTIVSQLRLLRYHELFLFYDPPLRASLLDQCARARFQLTSVYLSKPSSVILTHPYFASIKIQTFNRERDGLIDLAVLETDGELLYKSKEKGLTICLPLNVDLSDIRLEFGVISKSSNVMNSFTSLASYSHCWLNLYFETLRCSRDFSQTHFTLSELREEQRTGQEFLFVIKWSELDGVKGTTNRGLKLFDSITLKWKLL